jgi:hypothetical protein
VPTIEVPGHGLVEFPDTMSDDDIVRAIERDLSPVSQEGSGSRARSRALEQTKGLATEALPAMVGAAFGDTEYRDRKLEEYADRMARTERVYPADVPSFTDIKGIGDAGTYVWEAVNEGLVSMGPSLLAGGVGGLGARFVATQAGKRIVADAIERGATKEAAEKAVALAARRAATATKIGTATGAGVASATQNIPETFVDATGGTDVGAALIGGGIKTALDVLPQMRLLGNIFGREVAEKAILKRIGKEAAKNFGFEEATEGAQEFTDAGVEAYLERRPDLFSSDVLISSIDAALKGGISGGVAGGASAVFQRPRQFDTDPAAQSLVETPAVADPTTLTPQGPQGPPPELGQRAPSAIDEFLAPGETPIPEETTQRIDDLEKKVAKAVEAVETEPTEAQKEAGNYRKGHLSLHGLDIAVENPEGSIRRGTDKDGTPWEVEMPAHYGYVKRTNGKDGDQVDVYIGGSPQSDYVVVVDQFDPKTGKFDEHKAVLGVNSYRGALDIYDRAFSDGSGPQRRKEATPTTVDDFKKWLKDGDTTKPFSESQYASQARVGTDAVPQVRQIVRDAARQVLGPELSKRVQIDDIIPVETTGVKEEQLKAADAGRRDLLGVTEGSRLVRISLAQPTDQIRQTTFHEAFHLLDNLRLFTPQERQTFQTDAPAIRQFLQRAVDRLPYFKGLNVDEIARSPDELRAYGFEAYTALRNANAATPGLTGALRRLFERGYQFLRKVANGLKGKGFRTAQDVFKRVESGEVASRFRGLERKIESVGQARVEGQTPYVYKPMDVSEPTEGKVFYHGTKAPIDRLSEADVYQFSKVENLYGEGLYLTDNPNVARGYAERKGSGPEGKVLSARLKDLNLIDLEAPLPEAAWRVYARELSSYIDDDAIQRLRNAPGKKVFDELKEGMAYDGLTTSDVMEIYSGLNDQLSTAGYDGLRHEGGGRVRSQDYGPHNVVILFENEAIDRSGNLVGRRLQNKFEDGAAQARLASTMAADVKAAFKGDTGDPISYASDIGIFEKLFNHPTFLADKYPALRPLVDTLGKIRSMRSATQYRMWQDMKPFFDLSAPERLRVETAADLFNQSQTEPTMVGDKIVAPDGTVLAGKEAQALAGIRKALNGVWDQYLEAMQRAMGGQMDPALLAELQKRKNSGYIPQMRFGNIGFRVVDRDSGQTVWFQTIDASPIPGQVGRNITQRRINAIRARLKKEKFSDANFVVEPAFELTKDSWKDKNLLDAVGLVEATMMAFNLPKDSDVKAVLDQIQTELKKKGFKAHLAKRRNTPGYINDENRGNYLAQALPTYAARSSAYIARNYYGPELQAAAMEFGGKKDEDGNIIRPAQPKLGAYANKLVEYVSSPNEEFQFLKNLSFHWLLGANISSAAINLTQLMHSTLPYLTMMGGGGRAAKEVGRAFKDAVSTANLLQVSEGGIDWNRRPAGISGAEWAAMRKAHEEGLLFPVTTQELAGLANRDYGSFVPKIGVKGVKVMEAMMLAFNSVENINRITTWLAAYRMAQDPAMRQRADGILKNTRWADQPKTPDLLARAAVEDTQFVMGRENRPEFMRGAMALPTQFMSFPVQMLEQFIKAGKYYGGDGVFSTGPGKTMLALMALGVMSTAGVWGLPFAEPLKKAIEGIYRLVTGTRLDVDKEMREAIVAAGLDKNFGEAISKGLGRLAGIDISRRTSLEIVPTDLFSGNARDFLGPTGGVVLGSLADAHERFNQGQNLLGFAALMPTFLKNVITARENLRQGVVTGQGNVLLPPDRVGVGQALTKGVLGFTPAPEAQARELVAARQGLTQNVKDLRESYTDRLVKARREAQLASQRQNEEGFRSAMEDFRKLLGETREYDRKRKPDERLNINLKTVTDRVRRDLAGLSSKEQVKKMAKNARSAAKELSQIYPGGGE